MIKLRLLAMITGLCAVLLVDLGTAAEREKQVAVSGSIPTGVTTDVTEKLNQFLATAPDGSTVRFKPGSRYRIDGTVLIQGKKNITIDGNGAVFRAFDRGEDHAKKESYAGWRATRNRAHFRITSCQGIHVRNVEIHGAHPDPGKAGSYDSNREAQHGFDLVNVEDCVLEKVTVHDVYGDCVYIAKSRGVVVRDSKLTRCGRQGIAIGTGEDVLIENNHIADSRRGIIDVEPYGKEWRTTNIRIIGNRLGGSRLLLLPLGGSGTVGMVFVAGNVNTEHNGTPAVSNTGKPGQGRGPFMMVNNQLTIGGSSTQGLRVKHNDGVFIAGNALTFPAKRQMTALNLEGSHGVVAGNSFSGAASAITETPRISLLANSLDAKSKRPPTEWKRIAGGFAVRVKLPDGEVVGLMRGGPRKDAQPVEIAGYGHSTADSFAWFHVRNGNVFGAGSRK